MRSKDILLSGNQQCLIVSDVLKYCSLPYDIIKNTLELIFKVTQVAVKTTEYLCKSWPPGFTVNTIVFKSQTLILRLTKC